MSRLPRLRSLRRPAVSPSLLAWLGAAGLVILFVWQQAAVDRLVVRLDRAEEARRELKGEVSALSMEAAQLSSLAQVESRARAELGLTPPRADQIVKLEFEGPVEDGSRFSLEPIVPEATAGPRREGNRP